MCNLKFKKRSEIIGISVYVILPWVLIIRILCGLIFTTVPSWIFNVVSLAIWIIITLIISIDNGKENT